MGWLRWVGSFKLQVSFAKEPNKRDYILQKSPIISKILLTVATPYDRVMTHELTLLSSHWKCQLYSVSIENTTPLKSTKLRNSNFSAHIQLKPKSRIVCVPRDTEECNLFFICGGFRGWSLLSGNCDSSQLNRADKVCCSALQCVAVCCSALQCVNSIHNINCL